jgi:hypothetical protein
MKPSIHFNDNDAMIPMTEDAWDMENDDEVALLATPIPSFIEPLFSPSDEEDMFQIISPLSANSYVSSSSPSCSTQRSFLSPTVSTEKSPPLWKRVSILKQRKSAPKEKPILSRNKKNRKEEIEIQFECFFEEDDENVEHELHFPSQDPKGSTKASLFRRTTVMQSWWTQTLGTVKRSCRKVPPIRARPERSSTPGTAPLGPSEEESQELITFEKSCLQGATSHSHEYDGSSSDEDNFTVHHRNMFVDAPIQFHIPFIVEPTSRWEENESLHHLNYFDTWDRDTSSTGMAFV